MDSEHKGDGNHYTTYFRQYSLSRCLFSRFLIENRSKTTVGNPRLGRWMSRDPESAMFPFESNYAANHNNPVMFVDSEGDFPGLGAVIGATSELLGQLVKNFIKNKEKYDSFGERLWQSFLDTDWMDVGIAAAVGAIIPSVGTFSYSTYSSQILGVSKKYFQKWLGKVTGKVVMFFFDFKRINREIHFRVAFVNSQTGWLRGKRDSDIKNDAWFTLIGIVSSTVDMYTNIFSGILMPSPNPNLELPATIYENISTFSWFQGNQWASNLVQQIFDGIIKGGFYNQVLKSDVTSNNYPIVHKGGRLEYSGYYDFVAEMSNVNDVVEIFSNKNVGSKGQENEPEPINLDKEALMNVVKSGHTLERND